MNRFAIPVSWLFYFKIQGMQNANINLSCYLSFLKSVRLSQLAWNVAAVFLCGRILAQARASTGLFPLYSSFHCHSPSPSKYHSFESPAGCEHASSFNLVLLALTVTLSLPNLMIEPGFCNHLIVIYPKFPIFLQGEGSAIGATHF
jgi:hypothetical protein